MSEREKRTSEQKPDRTANEWTEANEAMREAETRERGPIPGLRQSDTLGGSA